jgi:superfamily II DNA/RNA helicase
VSEVDLPTRPSYTNLVSTVIRDIGAPLGVRTGLAVGASGADMTGDLANWHRNAVHVLVGTPARLNDVMVKHSNNGGLPGGEVRMLVVSRNRIMLNLHRH